MWQGPRLLWGGSFEMRILLLKPRNPELDFGPAPFFHTEPLSLEYIASELVARGHQVRVIEDLDGR
jgi:hypothetical protein